MGGFLNLFGGNESSSSTTNTQTTTSINPNAFIRGNGTAVNNSVSGSNNSIFTTVNSLDADFGRYAIDANVAVTSEAFLFADRAQDKAYTFGGKVLDFAQTSNQDTLAFAGKQTAEANATTQTAIGATSAAYNKALDFGAKQTAVALDSLSQSSSMLNTAYKDAKGILGTNVILVAIGAGVLVMYFALRKN